MSSRKMTAAAAGMSAALSALGAPAAHAQALFKIGVAADFYSTVQNVIDDFLSAYNLTGTVATYIDSTANLKTCILTPSTATNFSTNCTYGVQYDLLLAANTAAPAAIAAQTDPPLGMVVNGVTQGTFFYATGSLELYSLPTGPDISAGLPSTLTVPFVIADPSKAPYGLAAMTVLNTPPWSLGLNTVAPYPQTTSGPASFVHTAANVELTFEQVGDPYAYGFVAKAAICTEVGGTEFFTAGHHFEYLFNSTQNPYPQIVQWGIPIELGQTSTTKTQVVNFVDYIQGSGPDGFGLTDVQFGCYGTTAP
jgi:molybdate transport system substrate-binding protein